MCLHKHTIVHQHLYNIKGVIYKSIGIVALLSSRLQFLHQGKSRFRQA